MSYTVVFLCRARLHDISAFGTFFWSGKCFRKKVLPFISKFSSSVWRKVVNSDVGIIVICQSRMVFPTEPPLSYIPQLVAQYFNVPRIWMNETLFVFLNFLSFTLRSVLNHNLWSNHCPRQPRRGIPCSDSRQMKSPPAECSFKIPLLLLVLNGFIVCLFDGPNAWHIIDLHIEFFTLITCIGARSRRVWSVRNAATSHI